jgi:hypothetical protein
MLAIILCLSFSFSHTQSTIQLADYHQTIHDLGEATVIRET